MKGGYPSPRSGDHGAGAGVGRGAAREETKWDGEESEEGRVVGWFFAPSRSALIRPSGISALVTFSCHLGTFASSPRVTIGPHAKNDAIVAASARSLWS